MGNIQRWYVPGMYYIVCPVKQLIKLFPLLIRSQPKNILVPRFARLNRGSKPTTTLYVLIIDSSGWTLHLLDSLF